MIEGGWVYIMTNRRNGTLYTGVTNDLVRRVWEHREGVAEGFTRRYSLKRLVYFERHETITRGNPAGTQHQALAASLEGPAYSRS